MNASQATRFIVGDVTAHSSSLTVRWSETKISHKTVRQLRGLSIAEVISMGHGSPSHAICMLEDEGHVAASERWAKGKLRDEGGVDMS